MTGENTRCPDNPHTGIRQSNRPEDEVKEEIELHAGALRCLAYRIAHRPPVSMCVPSVHLQRTFYTVISVEGKRVFGRARHAPLTLSKEARYDGSALNSSFLALANGLKETVRSLVHYRAFCNDTIV